MKSDCKGLVLLAGAGHAHLHILRNVARLSSIGLRPVLVSPPTFYYSGLAAAILSGALRPGANTISMRRVCESRGLPFIEGRVLSVDRARRTARISSGEEIAFDYLSLNVGSEVDTSWIAGGGDRIVPVKPLSRLLEVREAIEAAAARRAPVPSVLVIGDGPSGVEVACAVEALQRRAFARANVAVVTAGEPFGWASSQIRDALSWVFRRRGIARIAGEGVSACREGLRLSDGRLIPADIIVAATGLRAGPLPEGLRLACDPQGRVIVARDLSPPEDPAIFAVGDCAVVSGAERPMLGVFGVRAAKVLLSNLLARGGGGVATAYHPQASWLSILDLGDGNGLAMWRGKAVYGRLALALKRTVDFAWLRSSGVPSGDTFQKAHQATGSS